MEAIAVSVPKASPEPLPELAAYLEPFAGLFRRSQSRQSLERYVTGLLTDLERKNCDTIAAAVAGTSTERLQHLLTDAGWDALEDAKGECGLDDYQGRPWEGLHRHLALAMLAYSFLVEQRVEATEEREGGFSPLSGATESTSRTQAPAGMAATGPRAVVHRYRPDQALPTSQKLTQ